MANQVLEALEAARDFVKGEAEMKCMLMVQDSEE